MLSLSINYEVFYKTFWCVYFVQIDLIDMRHRPDCTYKWIGHYMDYWSKIHILFPLRRKSAAEVALHLQNHVFIYLGTPNILNSDNEGEFVNYIVESLVREWPGEVTIVNGRPQNPTCQGLIEQGSAIVEKLIGVRIPEADGSDYSLGQNCYLIFSVSS